jgi:hypothetical protein
MSIAHTSMVAGLTIALAACSNGTDSKSEQGAPLCACSANDAGVLEVPLDCWCGARCPSLSEYLGLICDDSKPHRPITQQQTYEDCHLTVLSTGPSLGPLLMVYDSTTGKLVGATDGSDVPDLTCPGTEQPGYYSRAAGNYTIPASCHLSAERHPCQPGSDGSPD